MLRIILHWVEFLKESCIGKEANSPHIDCISRVFLFLSQVKILLLLYTSLYTLYVYLVYLVCVLLV